MNVELLHELAAVGFDCLDRQVQTARNLFGAQALGHELQHLALTR